MVGDSASFVLASLGAPPCQVLDVHQGWGGPRSRFVASGTRNGRVGRARESGDSASKRLLELAETVRSHGDDAAFHLIALDRLEQGLEVALAEAIVAFSLDDLEEDRTQHRLRED